MVSLAIEALRGVAAAAVVVDHCWALSGGKASFGIGIVQGLGTWGVNIFFMLSGYLLADSSSGSTDVGKTTLEFYIRRFFLHRAGVRHRAVWIPLPLLRPARSDLQHAGPQTGTRRT